MGDEECAEQFRELLAEGVSAQCTCPPGIDDPEDACVRCVEMGLTADQPRELFE